MSNAHPQLVFDSDDEAKPEAGKNGDGGQNENKYDSTN